MGGAQQPEFGKELAYHPEQLTRENIAAGMDRAALIKPRPGRWAARP